MCVVVSLNYELQGAEKNALYINTQGTTVLEIVVYIEHVYV